MTQALATPVAEAPPALRVVIVDDRPERRAQLRMAICGGPDPVDVAEVDDADAALDLMTRDGAAVVMLEIQIDGALALITTLRERYPELVIVACSFQADAATQELALGAGADSFLKKPMSSRELYRALVKTPD